MSAVRSAQAEVFPHNVMSSTRADAFGACPSVEKRTLPENAQRHDEDRTSSPFPDVMCPMALGCSSANHRLPSGPAVIRYGVWLGFGSAYSVNCPAGVMRP